MAVGRAWKTHHQAQRERKRLMVSDFIDEHNGFLALNPEEALQASHLRLKAREILMYGADQEGCWNSDMFMDQVNIAAKIAEKSILLTSSLLSGSSIRAADTACTKRMA